MLQLCVCRDIEHLGSLESTLEARGALGCASSNSYASFVLSKLPTCSIFRHTHELIVNCRHLGTKRNKNQLHDYICNRAGPINWDPNIVIPGSQLILPEKTADMSRYYNWFPHERMSEDWGTEIPYWWRVTASCSLKRHFAGKPVEASRSYRKIPKISPSKYKPPTPVTQKTLRYVAIPYWWLVTTSCFLKHHFAGKPVEASRSYRKIPKISPSKYEPPKLITQKTSVKSPLQI